MFVIDAVDDDESVLGGKVAVLAEVEAGGIGCDG